MNPETLGSFTLRSAALDVDLERRGQDATSILPGQITQHGCDEFLECRIIAESQQQAADSERERVIENSDMRPTRDFGALQCISGLPDCRR